MGRFRSHKTLQKFASVHAGLYNYFYHQRHLASRDTYKQNRAAALAEWNAVAA